MCLDCFIFDLKFFIYSKKKTSIFQLFSCLLFFFAMSFCELTIVYTSKACVIVKILIFSNLSRKYCFDPNIVATKCVHNESVHFDQ